MKYLIMCEGPNELEIIRMLYTIINIITTAPHFIVNIMVNTLMLFVDTIKRDKHLKGMHQKDKFNIAVFC